MDFCDLEYIFKWDLLLLSGFCSTATTKNFYQVALALFETEVHTISDQMMMPLLMTHQMNIEHNGSLSTLHIYSVH